MMKKIIISIIQVIVITLLLSLLMMPLCVMLGEHRGYALLGLPLAFVGALTIVFLLKRNRK